MTRGGAIAAGLAGAVSVALHSGVLIAFAPEAPESRAGGPPQLAMIGNSFEDAVAGVVEGTTDPATTPPVETSAAVADAVSPAPMAAARPAATAPAAAPSPPSSVVRPAISGAVPIPAVSGAPLSPRAARDLPGAAPVVPSPRDPAPAVRPAEALFSTRLAAPAQAGFAAEATVTAQDVPIARIPEPGTPRPRPRMASAEPVPPRQAEAPTPARQPTPQGHAAETARAGDARGAVEGNAPRSQAGTGVQAGNDGRAAAEYPQLVNRHLFRLRRPSTRFAGAAVVSFTIAANGGLAALSVARSSGNAEFDHLALAHVQRAAPFPPPPAGAQRRFNVTIKGR